MNIYSSKQLYEADLVTTKKQGISSLDLIERAAQQIFNWLHKRMQRAQVPIHIFCGIGNNGGGGLALGRLLLNEGYVVHMYIANFTDKRSKCFLANYDRVKKITKNWPLLMTCEADFPEIHQDDIIIDAIFGIGLNRAPEGWVKKLILYLNNQKAFRLSIDVPSGLSANSSLLDAEAVIYANHTLTFQTPKLSFFLPETGKYVPYFESVDIGLDIEYLSKIQPLAQLITKPIAQDFYKQREKFSHKGDYGHTLIIGGSLGKIGAISLASKAALTTGSGLVSAYIPKSGNIILQTSVPEVITLLDEEENTLASLTIDFKPSAIAIGMGMGKNEKQKQVLKQSFLLDTPIVIDADAINILSANKELIKTLPKNSILTPHEGELKRLIGDWKNDYEKIEKVKKFSKKYSCIILLKGANSITVFKDQMFINSTGNPGMATAGSGDVLSGVIASLLSQGYDPVTSTIFGAYLHGSSGNIASQEKGFEALNASDIINNLGASFLELFKQEPLPTEESNKQQ